MMLSYDNWRAKGRVVTKGERSAEKDANGVPLFSKDQTTALDLKTGTYKVLVSGSYAIAEKTKSKIPDGFKVLCRCNNYEDECTVVNAMKARESLLHW